MIDAALHVTRVVIVPPSVYNSDNSSTLYRMRARGANARGIAVIDETTPGAELERLRAAHFRLRSGTRKVLGGISRCSLVSRSLRAFVIW